MTRPFVLLIALALAFATAFAGCGKGSADDSAVEAMGRAAERSAGEGARYRMEGSIDVQGQSIQITGRASVEAGAKQGIVKMTLAGSEIETYVDGQSVLVSADALPSTAGLPAGTRYLRLDSAKIGDSLGLVESGPLRKLRSMDPGSAARIAAAASNIHSIGKATEDGVEVTRYEWSATFEEIAKALADGTDVTEKMHKALKDAKLSSQIAIDGDDRVRSFSIQMAFSGTKMDFKSTVTSYSKDISVDVPSGSEVFDVTDTVTGGLGDLGG